ncbi:TlpA family protein disulfide reductase [Chitinophaga sp. Ak27]|uniref:TlpA family protein disulfide reductase n=1 Tax=Chitinophaga sp. Ak27 TaxID=2726116 RepID=UPI00145DAA68|nr:TlpA disulfide reductase family protein [Chitinophaga sp. Ak27]NLU94558.1 TlpA family protein disulfide reductase [Chitinophaga sp. Ak27]
MTKSLFLLLLLALFYHTMPVAAQTKFKKGDSWLYLVQFTDSGFQQEPVQREKLYRIAITGTQANGTVQASATLEGYTITAGNTHYSSSQPATYPLSPDLMFPMLALYQPLSFFLHPNDSVGQPVNIPALVTAAANKVGLEPQWENAYSAWLKSAATEINHLFAHFPAQVVPGYQWNTTYWSYRVDSVRKSGIIISGIANREMPDTMKGRTTVSYTLSRDNGSVLTLTAVARLGHSANAPKVVTQVKRLPAATIVPPVDTAFYNMLIRIAYSNELLTKNNELDSAKLMNFLAINQPKYGLDATFKVATLNLLNRGRSEFIYELYHNLLKETTSDLIANNPNHLFNKLGDAVWRNTDTAVVLVKLLSANQPILNSWLDQSFSQGLRKRREEKEDTAAILKYFRESGMSEKRIAELFEEAEKVPAASRVLLSRLAREKDSVLQASVRPMYLWDQAMHTTDTATLKNIASQFGQVSATELTLGKAARYQLMVTGILKDAQLNAVAGQLLDKTLVDLVRNQQDTAFWRAHPELKEKKDANKNILAHAYYLKYQQTVKQDKDAAMNYLGLAAANSPGSNREKAHESFYDRVFLDSKEDYRAEFAAQLNALGKPQEAMKVLSRQLTTEPGMLDSARSFFDNHFPGKSFAGYFRDVLLKDWKDAPDFALTGINNERFRLADYRGKWLLLDFWGTWCPPCREDLPHLNKLAVEINEGKHPGNAILTISCHETLETARDFVKANAYVFAAAHSDSQVEKLYQVAGYPTKVLVSPEGKMLELQFGADYAAILKAYSDIYSQKDKEASDIKVHNKQKD